MSATSVSGAEGLAPASEGRKTSTHVLTRIVLPSVVVMFLAWQVSLSVLSVTDLQTAEIFYHLFARDRWAAVTGLGLLLLSVPLSALIRFDHVTRVVSAIGSHTRLLAAATTVILAVGAHAVYMTHPLSMDEYGALFQARIFAAGKLTGQLPPELIPRLFVPRFLGFFFTAAPSGAIVANYWPGFSLLLAPFVKLGVPWLLNPLLTGGTIILLARAARRLLPGTLAAGWVVLLSLASPGFVINGVSWYSMTAHVFFNTLFVVLLLDLTTRRAFAAGVVGSFALVLHNPVPHALFAIPWLTWLLVDRERRRYLLPILAGYLPLSILIGAGWFAFRWHLEGLTAALSAQRFHDPGQSAVAGIAGLLAYVFAAPTGYQLVVRTIELLKLFIWAAPALPVMAFVGYRVMKASSPMRLLACSAALTLAAHVFVAFNQGHGWGSRYFFPAWLALPLLAAALLARQTNEHVQRLCRFALPAAVLSLLVLNPLQAWNVRTFIQEQLDQVPASTGNGRIVRFIDPAAGYYTFDLVQNDPFLRGSSVTMWSQGIEEDARFVQRHFPGSRLLAASDVYNIWSIE
ncbi:MAG: hypothetical protein L0271_12570 [Gemmatimonadetes bacterium]|nr:hypothetical protein [Gemmatimonadota bacterium]